MDRILIISSTWHHPECSLLKWWPGLSEQLHWNMKAITLLALHLSTLHLMKLSMLKESDLCSWQEARPSSRRLTLRRLISGSQTLFLFTRNSITSWREEKNNSSTYILVENVVQLIESNGMESVRFIFYLRSLTGSCVFLINFPFERKTWVSMIYIELMNEGVHINCYL